MVCAILAGFFLRELLTQFYPHQDIAKVFCGFILYYFLADQLLRFMMQNLPTLTIQPYLVQNIKRRELIKFLNVRSLFTLLNLLPFVLFIPFTVVVIVPKYGLPASLGFIISILALTFFNHFTILYIKRKSIVNSWWYVIFFAIIGFFAVADYFHWFSFSRLSTAVFTGLLTHPLLNLFCIAMAVFAYSNNYRFLLKNLYLEDIAQKDKKKESADYAFLNRFGDVGDLISLDIKLILRNKRPRSTMMLTVAFLFYGFIFYKDKYIRENWWGMLLFGGIFITGVFVSNYGQFLFAWQSAHFDGLMAGTLSVKKYIRSKFVLFTAVCTLILLLSSFYGFISWKLLVVELAGYLYNVGAHTVIAVYFATRSYAGIDIGRGTTFNYQGMGAEKFLYTLVVLLVPMFIYWPFALLLTPLAGVIAVAVLGLVSLLLRNWWIDVLTKEFFKRKYKILDGFREH